MLACISCCHMTWWIVRSWLTQCGLNTRSDWLICRLLPLMIDVQSLFLMIFFQISIIWFDIWGRSAFILTMLWIWGLSFYLFDWCRSTRRSYLGLYWQWLLFKVGCCLFFCVFNELTIDMRSWFMPLILWVMGFFTLWLLFFQ